jgi:hypothetical protein
MSLTTVLILQVITMKACISIFLTMIPKWEGGLGWAIDPMRAMLK